MLDADAYLKRTTDQKRRRKLDEPKLIEDVFRIADRGRYLTLDQDIDGCGELLDPLAVARQPRAQPAHRHISRDLRTAVRHNADRIPPCFDSCDRRSASFACLRMFLVSSHTHLPRAWYLASISDFLGHSTEEVIGQLTIRSNRCWHQTPKGTVMTHFFATFFTVTIAHEPRS